MINKKIRCIIGFYTNKLFEKNIIREGSVSEIILKEMRYLQARIEFISTKKIFEYRRYQAFAVNLVTMQKKNVMLYSNLKFKLEERYVYFFESDFRKIETYDAWYKVYNNNYSIQSWLYKAKILLLTTKKLYKFRCINAEKFNVIASIFTGVHVSKQLNRQNFRRQFVKNRVNAYLVEKRFMMFFLVKTERKLFKTFKVKSGIFWYILKKVIYCFRTLNSVVVLKKNVWVNNVWVKVFIKLSYYKFFLKVLYIVLKKAAVVYYYFAKHFIYYYYKLVLNQYFLLKKKIKQKVSCVVLPKNIFNVVQKQQKFLSIVQCVYDIFFVFLFFLISTIEEVCFFGFSNTKGTLCIQRQRYRSLQPKPIYFFDFVGFVAGYVGLLKKLKWERHQQHKGVYRPKSKKLNMLSY